MLRFGRTTWLLLRFDYHRHLKEINVEIVLKNDMFIKIAVELQNV